MRGKAKRYKRLLCLTRITPAYAGKRILERACAGSGRDHPRVCGEKNTTTERAEFGVGSPPRMRGKDAERLNQRGVVGITPAYAGKSDNGGHKVLKVKDHPRVCGEKFTTLYQMRSASGSPPRMRGKGIVFTSFPFGSGITPAYAGKRNASFGTRWTIRDHPRVCGEKRKRQ